MVYIIYALGLGVYVSTDTLPYTIDYLHYGSPCLYSTALSLKGH